MSRGFTVVCTNISRVCNTSRVSNRSRVANISGVNIILRSRYQVHVQVLDDVHATNSFARTNILMYLNGVIDACYL